MQNTDQKTCEELLDKLSDKTLSKGCVIEKISEKWEILGMDEKNNYILYSSEYKKSLYFLTEDQFKYDKTIKIIGHPVMLGDVCEKLKNRIAGVAKRQIHEVIEKWGWLGFTTSLNKIIKESGWETVEYKKCSIAGVCDYNECLKEQLKNPESRALVEYIISLNL